MIDDAPRAVRYKNVRLDRWTDSVRRPDSPPVLSLTF
jgi:hypothetical protein